jgi:hypothetical protein
MPANKKVFDEEKANLKTPAFVLNGEQRKVIARRRLREANLLSDETKPWARHGSTPYLWTEDDLERAIDYVLNGQGDEPFR